MTQRQAGPRVAVMGGSVAGLTAALVLRDAGCDVDVYERSRALLEGRGVGIVLHPMTVRYLEERGGIDLDEVSTTASVHRYLDDAGEVLTEDPLAYRFTAYNTLYRALLGLFGEERYHLGHEVVAVEQDGDVVEFRFAAGQRGRAELVVGADGVASTVRRLLLPDVAPRYGGYVAWRGVVHESHLSPAAFEVLGDALTYYVRPHTHVLVYPIPGLDGQVEPGQRLANVVWYRNVQAGGALEELLTDRDGRRRDSSLPPGAVRQRYLDELCAAANAQLPWPIAEVVVKAGEPFLQVILDVEVPRMAFGRVCLIGDAAFAVRPHAAAATAKGAADAWALAEAVAARPDDVPAALRRWEPAQLALGRQLLARTREMGQRSQFRNTWRPGDPSLAFGLVVPGDSAQRR